MSNIFKRNYFLILVTLVIFSFGCSNEGVTKSDQSLIKQTNPEPTTVDNSIKNNETKALEIQNIVYQFPEIYDVAVAKKNNKTLVAYKVKHMQRFRMKKIQKQIKNKLKKTFPSEKMIISNDFKIFLEIVKLNEQLQSGKITSADAEKKFNYIVNLTKEET